MEVWHVWITAAIILFIAEIFSPGFLLACFGIGCLASGLVAFFELSFEIQTITFSVTTLAVIFGIRPLFLKHFYSSATQIRTNVDALVGKIGLVSERIDASTNKGRVLVGGEDWRGVSVDDTVIETAEKVTVVKAEGTKLFVRPVSTRKEDVQ